ncbi:Tyrosine tRNA ligase [Mycena chlorophos]|uniref:tyrosine--tRNA ligase n=1 Tax=Mycena chlorophos TaxID=658473 RepID=A0A8H6S4Z0_MYCCL|nr:Tyrosine tRNA ligase [Mycena chlorophos]
MLWRPVLNHSGDLIRAILAEEGRTLKGYFGASFSLLLGYIRVSSLPQELRRPADVSSIPLEYAPHNARRLAHIGYFVPLTKISDFLQAGVEMTILFADIHAFLDNMKAPIELVGHRVKYYQALLRAVFKSLGIPQSKLKFALGSDYQLSKEFNMDNYRLCATVTEHDAKKAGAEVVKQVDSALLSGLLYPGLVASTKSVFLLPVRLFADDRPLIYFQRKIFTFAELYLPRLGYTKRAHLMNAMVPGLAGGKMSSSDPNSKIDFLDSPEAVKKKIKLAFCEEGTVEGNGVLAFVEAVLIPISKLRIENLRSNGAILDEPLQPFVAEGAPEGTVFSIARDEKFGGPMHYASYAELRDSFASKALHPGDLKQAVAASINKLLDPIRKAFEDDKEWQEIEKLAYPDPNAKMVKKPKKEKVYHPPPPGKGKNANNQPPPPAPEAAA